MLGGNVVGVFVALAFYPLLYLFFKKITDEDQLEGL
jgi:hypothetical protein